MYIISKEFTFSASHSLPLPADHPCSRLHGHNYTVSVFISGTPKIDGGFVLDYRDFKTFEDWLMTTFDHRHLNDIITPPTVERLSEFIFHHADSLLSTDSARVCAVEVSETPKTRCRYEA